MPNWCSNELIVTGPEEVLGRFHDAHRTSDKDGSPAFTFEGSVPMPKVLRSIKSGGRTIDGESVTVWWERNGEAFPISPVTQDRLRTRYGAVNWYDWAQKNWGTKWDAGEVDHDASPEYRYYAFNTAWGPPAEWAKRASAAYPELRFSIDYSEPGMGFSGEFIVAGGAVLSDVQTEDVE